RCSGIPGPTPLFSTLLNYRHTRRAAAGAQSLWGHVEWLRGEERTNYPLTISIDDLGEAFNLTVQTLPWIGPKRICEFMHTALARLVDALMNGPGRAISSLDVLPENERIQVVDEWND